MSLIRAFLFIALAVYSRESLAQTKNTYELPPIAAEANRIVADASSLQNAAATLPLEELSSNRFRDISDALNSYPGIVSYRRTHATSAHPTTQGVRIRNVGANATSRALVLLDGVPQNDPFGAWVYWHQFDLSQLELVAVHPSGSTEIWGNMSTGGLLSLVSQAPLPGSRELQASIGSSERFDLRANAAYPLGDQSVFDLGIRHFQSDGFHTLRADQRGSVDRPAYSKTSSAKGRLTWQNGDDWTSQLSLRAFDEKRGNGTAVAQNDSQAFDLSLISERQLASQDARINLSLYLQDRSFQNVFSAVSEDRNSELPALDQYDVPAQSIGGAVVYRQDEDLPLAYSAGLDFRLVDGSVNERFRNLGAGFTRDRYAGGEQAFFGAFGKLTAQAGEADTLSTTLRFDRVEQRAGRRIETDTTSDTIILDESYTDKSDSVLTGNVSWRHQFSDTASSNLTVFSGFRAPTLNELYRPFRVRNDITEANPSLVNEKHQGIELSYERSLGETGSLRLSAFSYEAKELVANALFTTESGFDPRFGFIPNGGSGSARVNIDESTVSGIEIHLRKNLIRSLQASLTAVYAKTEIDADELSELVGNAFPQSSPWRAVASLDWQASEDIALWTQYRWADRSYEDLSNNRRLGANADLVIGAGYQLNEQTRLTLTLSNALDEENVTGIDGNGLVTIDEPRELLLTLSWRP